MKKNFTLLLLSSIFSLIGFNLNAQCLTSPFTEDFAAGTQPSCVNISATFGGPWDFNGITWNTTGCSPAPSDHTSGGGGFFASMDHSSNDTSVVLEFDSIDITATANPYLTFFYYLCGSGYSPVNILIVETFDGTNWVEVDSIQEGFGAWTEYNYDLTGNTFGTNLLKFRFRAESGGHSSDFFGDQAIDDVSITQTPSCFKPTSLSTASLTSGVELNWTENNGATSWEIEYGLTGFTQGTGTSKIASTNPDTLTALSIGSSYDWYIRTICGVADTSIWVSGGTFFFAGSPLSGTYTLDSAIVTGGTNFQSFTDLVLSLTNAGVNGAVTVNVTAASGPYEEQVIITSVPGISATNSVTINGNGEIVQYDALTADRRIIGLDGAKHITLDSLTIKSLNTTYGYGVHLMNSADSNTIRNCTIDLSSITSTSSINSAGVLSSGSISSTSTDGVNASYTLVENNRIIGGASGGPYASVYFNGDGSGSNSFGNQVINNELSDWYSRAVYVDDQEDIVISGNDISRPNRTTSTTHYGVYIASGSTQNMLIEKNEIHGLQDGDLTPSSTGYPIYSTGNDAAVGKENEVINNLIYDIKSTGTIYAIYNSSSDNINYYHNSISLDDASATSGTTRGFYQTTTATGVDFRNNIISIKRGGTSIKHGIYLNTTASTVTCDYNDIFISSAGSGAQYVGRYGTTDYVDLTNWRTANANAYGQNSTDDNPKYTSLSDLTPRGSGADETGFDLSVVDDFFGVVRDVTPDMGAIDFTAPLITCADPSGQINSSITDSSATLHWTDNAGAIQWIIEYDTAGFTIGTGSTVVVNIDTFTTITGLVGQTDYEWYVRTVCAPADSSLNFGPGVFTTDCSPVITGYLEDFTTYIPECWEEADGQLLPTTVFTSTTSSDWVSDGYLNVGTTGSARLNIWSTNRFEWLISPSIDLGNGSSQFQIEFDLGLTDFSGSGPDVMSADDTLSVVISTDNGATWSSSNVLRLYDANNQPANAGQHVVISLAAYTGNVKIGFYGTSTISNTDYNVYVDNFEVAPLASCPAPSSQFVSSVTDSSAALRWNENGTATQWEIEYGTSGFTLGSGSIVIVNTDTFTTITGLSAQTDYEWYVRAICAPADSSSIVGASTFTTPCMAFTAPYTMDFDTSMTNLPDCWAMNGTDDWEFRNTGTGHIGNNGTLSGSTASGGYFAWVDDSSPHEQGTTLESPLIDVSGLTRPQLTFYTISDNEGDPNGNVDFHVDVFDGTNWNDSLFFSDTNSLSGAWEQITVDLSTLNITGPIQIRFIVDENNGTGFDDDRAIDDIVVDQGPCRVPMALMASNISSDTTDISWMENGTATSWQVSYDTAGFTAGNGNLMIVNTDTFTTISGLMASTNYDWYVRAICAPGDTSAWSVVASFTTMAAPVCAIPTNLMTSNISTDTVDVSWMENGTATSWEIEYDTSGFPLGAGNQAIVSSNPFTLNSLTSCTDYEWRVRAICAPGDTSAWSALDSFTTVCIMPCAIPTNLMTSNISTDTADVSWMENGTATSWQLSYDTSGFTVGNGNSLIVNIDTFTTITGLMANTNYEWYVRAICAPGDTSAWSDTASFTTMAIPLPFYPIATINTEDTNGVADSLNVNCWTTGTVMGIDLDGNTGISFYITEQSTGSQEGIVVFNFNDVSSYVVNEGDSIRLRGEVTQFNGLTQFNPDSIEILSTGNNIPTPMITDSLGEFTEAKLLTLSSNFILLSPSGSGSFNMNATNGTDTITIRVDSDTDIDDSLSSAPLNIGDTICGLTGIGGQFDNSNPFTDGYQVFPMRYSDLTICRVPLPTVIPFYPINIINTEDPSGVADSLGVFCWTSGTVMGVDLDGNNGISFYITEQSTSSQEGVVVFNFNDISGYVVNESDSIRVRGQVTQFNGLTQFNPDSIELISTGSTLPSPRTVTNLDESTEAQLLRMDTVTIISVIPAGPGTNYDMVTLSGDTVQMRVDNDTDIDDSITFAVNDVICMIGIGGQFDNSNPFTGNYQIFPMRFSDVDTSCSIIVGIVDLKSNEPSFIIAPNPTTGEFKIRAIGFSNSTVQLQIRDISGKIIRNEMIGNANRSFYRTFDLKSNSSGLYFISVLDVDHVIHKKLILR